METGRSPPAGEGGREVPTPGICEPSLLPAVCMPLHLQNNGSSQMGKMVLSWKNQGGLHGGGGILVGP